MATKRARGSKLASVEYKGETIKANDCVIINPEQTSTGLDYIGKIVHIVQSDKGGSITLQVNWFYRPEEALGGRKSFHGEQEVFMSDHFDECDLNSVIRKCRVMSLQKYQELENIDKERDFFARFMYRPAKKQFEPPKVPVFCFCEMPYNPDKKMVSCDQCTEWYHYECLNIKEKSLRAPEKWICLNCLEALALCKQQQALGTPIKQEKVPPAGRD